MAAWLRPSGGTTRWPAHGRRLRAAIAICVLVPAVIAAVLAFSRPFSATATPTCTRTWTGGAGTTSWSDADNWNPVGLPLSTDHVCIGTGATADHGSGDDSVQTVQSTGTLVLSGGSLSLTDTADASNVTNLTQSGGTLGGTGALVVSGSFSWSGGEQTDAGTTRVGAGGALTIDSGFAVFLSGGRTLRNDGAVAWVGGNVFASEGALVENAGSFDAGADGVFGFNGGARPLIHNGGTV